MDGGAWLGAIRRVLGLHAGDAATTSPATPTGKLPVWDDAAAAAALGGDRAHVVALRSLFLAELPAQRDAAMAAFERGDGAAAMAELHRLQASCGFVGAARLATAVDALRVAMDSDQARATFAHAVQDALDSAG